MLLIRQPQMKALESISLRRFEESMLPHVARYFPNHRAILGKDRVLRVVRLGIEKAAAHGLTANSDVCRYVNLMLVFGSHFERDPQLPWAREILLGMSAAAPPVRLDLLAEAGLGFFDRISGPGHHYFNRAFLRLRRDLPSIRARAVRGDLAGHLRAIFLAAYPAKSAAIGDPALRELAALARATAARHGIESEEGVALVAVIMFIAGSGFDEDPQHDWAAETLRDSTGEEAKLRALCDLARAQLAKWLTRRS